MTLQTGVSVTSTATTAAPVAVAATDTIAQADIGTNGALLNVINGSGSPITVTISDPNATAVGNVGTTAAQSVAAGADRWFRLSPAHVNTAASPLVATVTYSAITTVTCKLLRC